MIDEIWGERPPASANKLVQGYVSNLRKALGDGLLVTQGHGYLLRIPPGQLDVNRFEALLAEGRHALAGGDPGRAAARLGEALGVWHGPPLADFAYEPFAQAEMARLVELHVVALEERIEAELALGDHGRLVGELSALVREHPLRERLRGHLMLALYRSGRQTDALAAYRELSELLRDELGLEPTETLRQLESAILRHDRSLEPATRKRPAGNLPIPATPFLGRTRELAEVTALLRRAGTRLLTLTGAGGSGKTRLALRAAQTCAEDFNDGAWFVGLADIVDPELLMPTICQALGLAEQPNQTPGERLDTYLNSHAVLLVLDNLEQLGATAGDLGQLLAGCQGVTILVTSREPLHLAGEQQYQVPVLEPDDAIELFTSRARSVAPPLNVDLDVAGAICERLDRLPLAIELAAARTKILSPAEILVRLEHRMPVLAAGPRDAPRRQQTLTATIDWSYELLTPAQQQLFARLAVFVGGCTVQAAETVCAADLDTLQALVDRSLLRREDGRYRMLQTLRQYALQELERGGEADDLRSRHANWFVEALRPSGIDHGTWRTPATLALLTPERENIYAALEWAVSGRGDAETLALLTAWMTERWWIRQGQLDEAQRLVDLALDGRDACTPLTVSKVLIAARNLAWHRGENDRCVALSEQALELSRELGDLEGICDAMLFLDEVTRARGDLAAARRGLEETVAFAREHDLEHLPAALLSLSDAVIAEGSLDQGRALCEELLSYPDFDNTRRVAELNLAHVEILQGRYTDAERLTSDAFTGSLASGDRLSSAWAATGLACALAKQGELEAAGLLLGAALSFLEDAGARLDWMSEVWGREVRMILEETLDQDEARALIEKGRGLSLEQVVGAMLVEVPHKSSQ